MNDARPDAIEHLLAGPTSDLFWVEYADGQATCGHADSLYAQKIPDPYLVYDVSNNRAMVNVELNGSIKHFNVYRGGYASDPMAPGIWWYKDFSQVGPFFYELELGDERFNLAETDWPIRMDLLGDVIPVTTLTGPGVEAKLVNYTPVSSEGSHRPRAAIYGMLLRNTSDTSVAGKIILPQSQPKVSDSYESFNVFIDLADGMASDGGAFAFDLTPGETIWTPAVITAIPGQEGMDEIARYSSGQWLAQTLAYFRGLTGDLSMPDDPFPAALLARTVQECLGGVAMDASGEMVGANWSRYPATMQTWMKDLYHMLTPLATHDPEFLQHGILWFLDRSVRHKGDKLYEGYLLEGGVSFSLANTLAPVVLSGMYYRATGDRTFFEDHPEVLAKCTELLDAVLATREGEAHLYPSVWLSDGLSRGDYNTGSNLIAWVGLTLVSDILEDIAGDTDRAKRYRESADKTKADLDRWCIAEGPMGPQYIEGAFVDGTFEMHHDGEETDTTLMPFYGYCPYDHPPHQNNCRVAMTGDNLWYKSNTKGIRDSTWISDPVPSIDATYPGYMTGLAGAQNAEDMNGPDGLMMRIRERVDVDGSIWWWPFREDQINRAYEIHGGIVGKSGWACGVYANHFVSQILGLDYDGRCRTLHAKPFSPTSDYTWKQCRLGSGTFDVAFARVAGAVELMVTNRNDHAVTVEAELILPEGESLTRLEVDGAPRDSNGAGTFFDAVTVKVTLELLAGASTAARAIYA
jgi:hypothetical protein